jgi:predicted nucleic acid-binding protein
VLDAEPQPAILPATALCEIGHLGASRFGGRAVDAVLRDVEAGALVLDCGDHDLARVRHLVTRYDDLGLGVTDAFVAACAERNGGRILTLDRRHFDVLARELGLVLLP